MVMPDVKFVLLYYKSCDLLIGRQYYRYGALKKSSTCS